VISFVDGVVSLLFREDAALPSPKLREILSNSVDSVQSSSPRSFFLPSERGWGSAGAGQEFRGVVGKSRV